MLKRENFYLSAWELKCISHSLPPHMLVQLFLSAKWEVSYPAVCLALVICCRCCQAVIGLEICKWTWEEFLSFLHSPLTKITMGFFFKIFGHTDYPIRFINVKLIHKCLHRNNFKSLLLFTLSPSYWHKANERSAFHISWYFDSFYSPDLFALSWVLTLIHFVINLTSSGSILLSQKSGCFSSIEDWNFMIPLSP